LFEEFEYKGCWWLPEKPERKIPGTLKFVPGEEIDLKLQGTFKDVEDIDKLLKLPIVLGLLSDGRKITLYKCQEKTFHISSSSSLTYSSVFVAGFIFIGAHFQKPEDIKFKSISVYYSNLDEWVSISGFDYPPLWKDEEIEVKSFSITANINDNLEISIIFPRKIKQPRYMRPISQEAFIKFETLKASPFYNYYLKVIQHLRIFLSLGVTNPIYPLSIKGIIDEEKDDKSNNSVDIFYIISPRISKLPKVLQPSEMLFTFVDISDKFETILRNWFEKNKILEPVYFLYDAVLYNPNEYLENQFLNLIQAIESFHRRIYEGTYVSKDEYKEIYTILINSIPNCVRQDLRKHLSQHLKYGNEFSLRKRLKEIFDKHGEILNIFIKNKEDFIDKVINERNYLTHYPKESEKHIVAEEEFYRINLTLRLILEICLLTEIGFSSEKLESLFQKNEKYKLIKGFEDK